MSILTARHLGLLGANVGSRVEGGVEESVVDGGNAGGFDWRAARGDGADYTGLEGGLEDVFAEGLAGSSGTDERHSCAERRGLDSSDEAIFEGALGAEGDAGGEAGSASGGTGQEGSADFCLSCSTQEGRCEACDVAGAVEGTDAEAEGWIGGEVAPRADEGLLGGFEVGQAEGVGEGEGGGDETFGGVTEPSADAFGDCFDTTEDGVGGDAGAVSCGTKDFVRHSSLFFRRKRGDKLAKSGHGSYLAGVGATIRI